MPSPWRRSRPRRRRGRLESGPETVARPKPPRPRGRVAPERRRFPRALGWRRASCGRPIAGGSPVRDAEVTVARREGTSRGFGLCRAALTSPEPGDRAASAGDDQAAIRREDDLGRPRSAVVRRRQAGRIGAGIADRDEIAALEWW